MSEQTISARSAEPMFSRDALVRLIIPLVIEQLLLMTVGMADTVMVTTCGEAVVSGVSLVDNINTLIIQIFTALSTGGAVVVAQYLGRGEQQGARLAAKQLLYTMTGISTVLMLLALVLRQHILSLVFGQVEPAVMESALEYFLITAAAYPFMGIYNAGAALFRAMGNSKVSSTSSTSASMLCASMALIWPLPAPAWAHLSPVSLRQSLSWLCCGIPDSLCGWTMFSTLNSMGAWCAGSSSSVSPTAWRTECSRWASCWCST